MAHIPLDPVLMAHDTTCVDAIDKDGMMFSATPSGAWLPSVIAGDTGIPLSVRAQSFVLIPGSPNELGPGKRPRVTLSPTLVTSADGKPVEVLSTPGGDTQEQGLLQVLFNSLIFRMNAENSIEAPRFGTRHLVSSFDNHAWERGDLQLDDRIPAAVAADLTARGHQVSTMSRYSNGTAPVLIRVLDGGAHRGRRRSVLQPLGARLVSDAPAFRSASGVRSSGAGRTPALAGGAKYLDRDQFVEVSRLAGSDLFPRPLHDARQVLPEALRGRVSGGVRRNISHRLRRLLLLSISDAGILAAPVCHRPRRAALRVKSSGGGHGRGVPQACALRPAGRHEERIFSERRCAGRGVSGTSGALSRPHRDADLRVWCALHRAARIHRPARTISWTRCRRRFAIRSKCAIEAT